jgi:hypothetical protein
VGPSKNRLLDRATLTFVILFVGIFLATIPGVSQSHAPFRPPPLLHTHLTTWRGVARSAPPLSDCCMRQAIFLANDGAACKSASFAMWALAMSNVICHGVCLGVPIAALLLQTGATVCGGLCRDMDCCKSSMPADSDGGGGGGGGTGAGTGTATGTATNGH